MFIFLDTETTGLNDNDRLCQLAYKTDNGITVNELFNPGMPIPIEAMCVHHITNDMVKDKPAFKTSKTWHNLNELLKSDDTILVAHNAPFDVGMLKKEGITVNKNICTLKLSRYLDAEGVIPHHNLQYLRYYLNLNVKANAHDALGDILVLEALFERLYAKIIEKYPDGASDKMIDISSKPVLIRKMPFGKHKGIKMEEIPIDYLHWLSTTDLEEDLKYTVRYYLGRTGS